MAISHHERSWLDWEPIEEATTATRFGVGLLGGVREMKWD